MRGLPLSAAPLGRWSRSYGAAEAGGDLLDVGEGLFVLEKGAGVSGILVATTRSG
jgi:hypothetical protein